MVAEDKFFAAQHLKVFKKRMPNWTAKMLCAQMLALAMFVLGTGYAPFCPQKYSHGKQAQQRSPNKPILLTLPPHSSLLSPCQAS